MGVSGQYSLLPERRVSKARARSPDSGGAWRFYGFCCKSNFSLYI